MKVFTLLILFGLLFGCALLPSIAQEPPPELMAATEKTMSFYESPSQDIFTDIVAAQNGIMRWIGEYGSPDSARHMERLFQVFVSFAWKKGGYTGSPLTEDKMNSIVKSISSKKISGPDDLDTIWAAFFATGDEKHLDQLSDATASKDPFISGAAQWSLNANYKQRKAVKEYFDRQPSKKETIIR